MKNKILLFIILVTTVTLTPSAHGAFLNLSGNLTFTSNESSSKTKRVISTPSTTNTTTSSSSSESETRAYNFALSKQLTSVLTVRGDVSYYERTSGGRTVSYTNSVASLTFNPPALYIFKFSAGRTQTFPAENIGLINSHMRLSFALPTSKKLPSLSVSYNWSGIEDDQTPHLIDSESASLAMSSGYSFKFLKETANVGYSIVQGNSKDNLSGISNTQVTNSLSLSWGKGYFDNKLRTSYNASFSGSENTVESNLAQRFEAELEPDSIDGRGLAGIGLAAAPVSIEPTVINNDNQNAITTVPSVDLSAVAGWNIGVGIGLVPEIIHKIKLYISVPSTDATNFINNQTTIMNSLGWIRYTSVTNSTWGGSLPLKPSTAQLVGVSGTDTIFVLSFEFLEISTRYVKLYNSGISGTAYPITVTEMEVFEFLSAETSRSFSQERSGSSFGFSVNYKHSKKLMVGYSFSFSKSESDSSKGAQSSSHSLFSSWRYSKKFRLSGAFSSSYSENLDSGRDNGASSFSFSGSYRPIGAIGTSFSFSNSASEANGVEVGTSNNYNISIGAKIYEGVSISTSMRVSSSENPISNSESEFQQTTWSLHLKPWAPLDLYLSSSSSENATKSQEGKISSSTDSMNATVSLRATRSIFLSANYSLEPTQSATYSLSWRLMKNIQLSSIYGTSDNRKNYSLSLNWRVLRNLFMQLSHRWNEVETLSGYKANPPVEPEPKTIKSYSEGESTRFSLNFSF